MATIEARSTHNISQFNKDGLLEIRRGVSYTQSISTPPPLLLRVEHACVQLYTQHNDTLVVASPDNYRYRLEICDVFGRPTTLTIEMRRRLLAKGIFAHFLHHSIPYKVKETRNKSLVVTINEFSGTEVGWYVRVGGEYKRGVIGLSLPRDASLSLRLVVFAGMLLVSE